MATARKHLVDDSASGCFHCITRCVRRAYLCGDAAEHRRDWVRERVRAAAAAFAIDVLAYAVMGNHLHLVVRTDPDRVVGWSADDIAGRWADAHPHIGHDGTSLPWSEADRAGRARDAAWVAKTRLRLRSLSWFMKSITERLARRANGADGCTGHFWEGRFRSVPLLDQAAVIACMAYVDLNPIRAGIADRPETSDYTSVQERIAARQAHHQTQDTAGHPTPALDPQGPASTSSAADVRLWIAPLSRITASSATQALDLDAYLTLVDETGRLVRSGKRGAISPLLQPILERLELQPAAWMGTMNAGGGFRGGGFGRLTDRAREAARRGARWIIDLTRGLYARPGVVT